MEATINNLKSNFTEILDENNNITKSFEILNAKIVILKNFYAEFIKNNNQNIFLFGLDSFRFQSRLIDLEYDDMKRLHSAICNRIYCEYYKLHKLVNEYVRDNISENKILDLVKVDSFVQYKDLEPFKVYDFQIIQDIHENILLILSSLYGYIQGKEHELKNYNEKKEMGLNIDNFVFTFNYSIVVVREKLMLFMNYMEFFHKLHLKYLRRFTRKIQLMIEELNNDIIFEERIKPSKNGFANVVKTAIINKERVKTYIEPDIIEYIPIKQQEEKPIIVNNIVEEIVPITIEITPECIIEEENIESIKERVYEEEKVIEEENDTDTDDEYTTNKEYVNLIEFGKSNSMMVIEEENEKKKQNLEIGLETQKEESTEIVCKLEEKLNEEILEEEKPIQIVNSEKHEFNIDEHQNFQENN